MVMTPSTGHRRWSASTRAWTLSWRTERPLPYLGPRLFSVRWTGALAPAVTGRYRLGFRGCGRFTVWFDGRIVMTGDNPHHPMLGVCDVDLESGRDYDLRIDYTPGIHVAHAQLLWATPGQAQVEREQALAVCGRCGRHRRVHGPLACPRG